MNPGPKLLIITGVVCIVAGLLWYLLGDKIPFGRLPGDIRIESENSKVFIPITTCIIISVILSAISYFFRK